MEPEFINLSPENVSLEHLCCIIRTRKPNLGIEAKREWLSLRLSEGHVFRKLNAKAPVFIEYAPLDKAWVPIVGKNYYYIYCLWVLGEYKGKGYGRALMEYSIKDAKEKGANGLCLLGADKQKAWLTDQLFAEKFGFETVDKTHNGYKLLALSFNDIKPTFTQTAKKMTIDSQVLTIYYDLQCPYVGQSIDTVTKYCQSNLIPFNLIKVDTLEKAKQLPCVFNNWAVFYKGIFQTVNLLDLAYLKRILAK